MTRMPSSADRMRPRVLAAIAVLIAAAVLAPAAHAGLGDLVKKAKEKAAQVAGQKAAASTDAPGAAEAADAAGGKVEFTDVILELTNDRLDHFLTGMKAGAGDPARRTALVAKKDNLIAQQDALVAKYGPAIDASRQQRDAVEDCWKESLRAAREKNNDAMREKMMSDPAMRDRMIEMSQRMGMAQAQGDTATVGEVQREMMRMAGPTHADTLAARQKCGPLPALHFAAVQADSLQALAAAADEKIRDLDRKVEDARTQASGMGAAQFAMARERIEMYLAAIGAKSKPRAFTAGELAALEAHQDALKAALE